MKEMLKSEKKTNLQQIEVVCKNHGIDKPCKTNPRYF